jgi:hypothetical protein
MIAWPENERAACTRCGRTYLVDFPAEREEIERLLLLRPERDRNWEPGQTVEDLRRENEERGWLG